MSNIYELIKKRLKEIIEKNQDLTEQWQQLERSNEIIAAQCNKMEDYMIQYEKENTDFIKKDFEAIKEKIRKARENIKKNIFEIETTQELIKLNNKTIELYRKT